MPVAPISRPSLPYLRSLQRMAGLLSYLYTEGERLGWPTCDFAPEFEPSTSRTYSEGETRRNVKLLRTYLARTNFNVEVISFEGYFQNLSPGEPVDSQTVAVDEETARADSQQNLDAFRILSVGKQKQESPPIDPTGIIIIIMIIMFY